jgi:peptidoglycan hydrolase CwlO-like protein
LGQLVSDLVQEIQSLNDTILELYSKCQDLHDEVEKLQKEALYKEAQIMALTKEIQHALTEERPTDHNQS